jgi:DNA-binding response OmpR family regulator
VVVIIVILTVLIFFLVDLSLRMMLKRRQEARYRREREEALDFGLKLDFTEEAPSLKRVDVENAKARILAVDDEPVVLDSFRKILVLEGYSIETVETAQEALGLVRKNDYDFVFTDLKMPGMDGLDLTKAVKHLRPDIDVAMITGYGTIESAVETMRFGAMDYVEKPFTPDELAEFTKRCLIRRQHRIEQETAPKVQLITAGARQSDSPQVINVPGGLFVSPQHTWVKVDVTGEARIGLDDFAVKALEILEEIEFPDLGFNAVKGEPLFSARRQGRTLVFPSPLTGRVTKVHHDLANHLDLLPRRPVGLGWICCVEPEHLSEELAELRIGADAIGWYEEEIRELWSKLPRADDQEDDAERWTAVWDSFQTVFLGSAKEEILV